MRRILLLATAVFLFQGATAAPLDDARAALKAKNYKRAATILLPLAESGDAAAQVTMATLYHTGSGVAKDHDKEIYWKKAAAEAGNSGAQHMLGFAYENGECVAQNFLKAAEWYGRSAEQGDAIGQYSLGLLYATGRGVVEDQIEAHKWITLAATRLSFAKETLEKRNSSLGRDIINAGQKQAAEFVPRREQPAQRQDKSGESKKSVGP